MSASEHLTAIVRPISYEVSLLPEDFPDGNSWTVYVEYRGDGRWAVKRHAKSLSADGSWSSGAGEAKDRHEWLARHRHDLDTALALAKQAAAAVTVGGITAAVAYQREQAGLAWTNGQPNN